MAEDTEEKEDLSVEDILSSIKDILMEDNAEQQKIIQHEDAEPTSEQNQSEAEKAATAEETADDVLTLSPSMIVEPSLSTSDLRPEEKKEDDADPLDLDFEREFDSLPAEPVLDDVEVKKEEDGHSPAVDEEPVDLTEISEVEDSAIEHNGTLDELEKIAPADVDAEPIFSSEDDVSHQENFKDEEDFSLDNLVDDDTLNAILNNQPEDPQPEDLVEPTDNVYETAVEEEKTNIIPKETVEIQAEPAEMSEEPKIEIKEEPKVDVKEISELKEEIAQPVEEKTVEEVEEQEDTTDISAGIISNFAKMFAEQQKQKQETENKEETKQHLAEEAMSHIELGNGSLTIEALVRDVINGIVEKNLSKNYDFSAAAAAEIARQTKSWLNAHLPEIVEAEVKKEIERVMAKVSS